MLYEDIIPPHVNDPLQGQIHDYSNYSPEQRSYKIFSSKEVSKRKAGCCFLKEQFIKITWVKKPTWCQKVIHWHCLLYKLHKYLVLRMIYGCISFYFEKLILLHHHFPVSNNNSCLAHKHHSVKFIAPIYQSASAGLQRSQAGNCHFHSFSSFGLDVQCQL